MTGGPARPCRPSTLANPATVPAMRYHAARFIAPSPARSQDVCLVVDGLAGHPEALGEVNHGGHEPLRPAHVEVALPKVRDELRQRPLIERGLLAGADEFVQPPVPVADQFRDLLR